MKGNFLGLEYDIHDRRFSVHILEILREELKKYKCEKIKLLCVLSMSRTVDLCKEYAKYNGFNKLNELKNTLVKVNEYMYDQNKDVLTMYKDYLKDLEEVYNSCSSLFDEGKYIYVNNFLDQGGVQILIEYFNEFIDWVENNSNLPSVRYAEIVLLPLELIEVYLDESDERDDTLILKELSRIEEDMKIINFSEFDAISCKNRIEKYFKLNVLSI